MQKSFFKFCFEIIKYYLLQEFQLLVRYEFLTFLVAKFHFSLFTLSKAVT